MLCVYYRSLELAHLEASASSSSATTYSQPRGPPIDPYATIMNDNDGDVEESGHQPGHENFDSMNKGLGASSIKIDLFQSYYAATPSTNATSTSRRQQQNSNSQRPNQQQNYSATPATAEDSATSALAQAVDWLATAPISAVVQDRLLRSIFNRYLADNVTVMNLTRY